MSPPPSLGPIERSVTVSWKPEAAFDRFTKEFGSWWPWRTHSVGGKRVRRVLFEPGPGGRIFEEHADGRRFQWGQVLEWDPPRRVRFTWHPAREPATAQQVEVRFEPRGAGTHVVLTSWGWENWGKKAQLARRGYRLGWGYVLNVWAGRRTPSMAILDGLMPLAALIERLRGGTDAAISRAGGEIPREKVSG